MVQHQPVWPLLGKLPYFRNSCASNLISFYRLFFSNSKTASEYLDQVQKLVYNENITTDMSSYTIFMNLLGKVLKRLAQSETKNQIMKIIGKSFLQTPINH